MQERRGEGGVEGRRKKEDEGERRGKWMGGDSILKRMDEAV